MAIKVVTNGTTQVKTVKVGTPVRRVASGGFQISNLGGVDISAAENGSILIYDATQSKFVASKELSEQDISGGQY